MGMKSMTDPKTVEEAFALGQAEHESDLTWADPARPDGGYTELDEAYDNGRYSMHAALSHGDGRK